MITLQLPWITKRTKLIISLWQWIGATWSCHPPSDGNYPKNTLKQEPDYSLQVITFKTGPRLWPHHSWDQPNHTCDWVCLTMHTFVPYPQFFCLFKFIAHVCTLKRAEDELSTHSASSFGMSWTVKKPPFFLSSSSLFIWHLGEGGQTWHMESQEFWPWVQNSHFNFSGRGSLKDLEEFMHSILGWGVAWVQCLPNIHEVLDSISNTT
jgi:hypothetical protein